MTCIIGLRHEGKIYMGCDSMAAEGWNQRQSTLPKVFIRDGFIIGYTTSFRMGQLLQYDLVLPVYSGKNDPVKFMVYDFIPAVRSILKSGGFAKIDDNRESGGEFLVGFKSGLFFIGSDFQVNQYADDFNAIGCGRDYALGALGAIWPSINYSPGSAIKRALEIAGYFSNGVMPPYFLEILE